MPLPTEIIAAQDRMRQAEAALQAHVESGERDSKKHLGLVESLQRAIHGYEDTIAALLRDMNFRR